jgi:hypothetical protein
MLGQLRDHDWSAHFPISEDFAIAAVDRQASKSKRREQLERSVGADRVAALERAEELATTTLRDDLSAIKPSRAKHALVAAIDGMQRDSVIDRSGPAPSQLWEAFLRFVAIPIEGCEPADDADMILIEYRTEQDRFILSFVRQLTPEGRNFEYTGMQTVSVRSLFRLDDTFKGILDSSHWFSPTDPMLKASAESLPGMRAVLERAVAPIEWQIDQDRV